MESAVGSVVVDGVVMVVNLDSCREQNTETRERCRFDIIDTILGQ